MQPIPRPGTGHRRGDRAVLLEQLRRHVPDADKIEVNGPNRDPIYRLLTDVEDSSGHRGDIRWNFEKFLVASDGTVVARFSPQTEPDAPAVRAAITAVS